MKIFFSWFFWKKRFLDTKADSRRMVENTMFNSNWPNLLSQNLFAKSLEPHLTHCLTVLLIKSLERQKFTSPFETQILWKWQLIVETSWKNIPKAQKFYMNGKISRQQDELSFQVVPTLNRSWKFQRKRSTRKKSTFPILITVRTLIISGSAPCAAWHGGGGREPPTVLSLLASPLLE